MEKQNLVQVLYYCPESNYYYDDHDLVRNMVTKWTRQEVLREVKALIARMNQWSVNEIEEMGSEYEKSVSAPNTFSSMDEPIPPLQHV